MTRKLAVINGLRGIAILAVIFTHLFNTWLPHDLWMVSVHGFPLFPLAAVTNARQGVALFFFLSGFVLTLPYARGDRTMAGPRDWLAFVVRRARRLLPLYALVLLVIAVFVYPHDLLRWGLVMPTMLFVFSEWMFNPFFNPTLWTIGVEWWAGLFLPFAIVAARRYGVGRTLAAIVIACFLVRLYGLTWAGYKTMIVNGLPGRFDDFAWGMAAAWIFARAPERIRAWWLWAGVVSASCGFWIFSAQITTDLPWEPVIWQLGNVFVGLACFLVTCGLLVRPRGVLRHLVTFPPLQMTGLMCYSLYMWHFIMITPLRPLADATHLLRYALVLGLLSWVTYRYVEFSHERDVRRLLPAADR